ncbi:MAG: hypothetical protein AAF721_27440, partial [Myxococcota bacterium]
PAHLVDARAGVEQGLRQAQRQPCPALGRGPAVALPILRRVETIYAATDRPPPKRRARLALRLSQALFHTRAGIDEVRRLADRAERFVGESEDPRGRDELDAWLAFLAEQGR